MRGVVGLAGAAVTTASAFLFVALFVVEAFGFLHNPYLGIVTYLVLPAIFLFGLLLIPIGVVVERKRAVRARALGEPVPGFPIIDLNLASVRKWILVFLGLSAVNVIILALATLKGVEVMDSSEFCGTTCHVMLPQHTVYQRSSHAQVKCVACHIGPGADWFVKAKLAGAWQVLSVAFDLYPRPIPAPVHDLRSASDTCEQCHGPTTFHGDRLRVITRHENDEANTVSTTVLGLRVGGRQGESSTGIHWHVDPGVRIRYRSDSARKNIYEVELTQPDGVVKTFRRDGSEGAAPAGDAAGTAHPWRVMDCVDCHNRPAHEFRMPADEVDQALQVGRIPRSLPYIRREGIRALSADYASHAEARRAIAQTLTSFYETEHPELSAAQPELIGAAVAGLGEIYVTNVFPSMNVIWGTYPDHGGHETSDGCFRCHNDEHSTPDGEVISQDCSLCHAILALEEEKPEILEMLEP